ncbi:hypothetical protein C1O63_0884 [Dehalococcoides mccartyi]|nr:hypothetical protein C1O63_0884 [Dehalococcoides mccartyi]
MNYRLTFFLRIYNTSFGLKNQKGLLPKSPFCNNRINTLRNAEPPPFQY